MKNEIVANRLFPKVFCLEHIQCIPLQDGGYRYLAVLFHDHACVSVSFSSDEQVTGLTAGCYVSVDWPETILSVNGALEVNGLKAQCCANEDFNPFETVPYRWRTNRHLVSCARDLWDAAPKKLKRMLRSTLISHFTCHTCCSPRCGQGKHKPALPRPSLSGRPAAG